ncbi:GPW/gp25 family protein [Pararhizobium haloflavum]|uniref:GPW/gp25 family protein n=1 Tax=Pararhizobium haloflavum TaxID=2037914 RepID=UPI000C18FD2A|nr:GPW/gp25 family protein [Pararhizobium haloflavum]
MADAVDLLSPSVDIDRVTGGNITGWDQVVQSIDEIMLTSFGERIMREWFGSMVPRLLGENLNEETVINFFAAIGSALDQWEPRFQISRIVPISVDRNGHFEVRLEGIYRPRALLGDFSAEGARRVNVFRDGSGLRARDA